MEINETENSVATECKNRIMEILETFFDTSTSVKVECLNEILFQHVAAKAKDSPDRVIEITQEVTETVNFLVSLQEEYSFYRKFCDVSPK